MTQNNPTANQFIEELPNSDIDSFIHRKANRVSPTSTSTHSQVIDTGTTKLESPTVQDIAVAREDNPFLRLAVIGGFMGVLVLFLWGIFAIISPKAPPKVEEEIAVEEEQVEENINYQAKLAFRDQFHSLEKKNQTVDDTELPPVQNTVLPEPASTPVPQPSAPRPVPRPAPRPIPQPPAPRPVSKPVPQPVAKVESPKVDPQQQWQSLSNFVTSVSSKSVVTGNRSQLTARGHQAKNEVSPALPVDSLSFASISQGELGILNRRKQSSLPKPAASLILERAATKAKIELPLVWDSSLSPEQQQSNQITVTLEEAIYDVDGEIAFEEGSVAIIQIDSINDRNGLVTAYVVQINDRLVESRNLILRDKKKSALIAKASNKSNFGNRLLVGGVDTLSGFGQQLLIPETSTVVSNGSTIISGQSRNSIGRDLGGSALDGFGSSLSTELEQRNTRNQIGDGGTIFTLSQGMTVYLTNIQPLKINP